MDFIGRSRELEILESEYVKNSSLTIIYGRRRVGKTTLINRFMMSKKGIYFLATEQNSHENLLSFSREISKSSDTDGLTFSSWESAMVYAVKQGNKVIAIDEFQYLAESNRSITSEFQHAWDTMLKESGVMLILCGSYIGMMEKYTLNQSSPLYGRRACVLKIEPLRFSEVARSIEFGNIRSAIEYYGVTGGVPRYMELLDPDDLRKNISDNILDRNGVLHEEPLFLLKNETKESANYISILTAISKGNSKIDRISGELQIKSNALSPYLESLISMGILERRVPVTEEVSRSRNGRFIIKDRFLRFWFRFVFPYMTSLGIGIKREVEREMDQHLNDSFIAFVFEDVCREYVQEGNIGEYDRVGAFWNSKMEIDIMALDLYSKKALVGECKYHKGPVSISVLNELKEKTGLIEKLDGFTIKYVIFSISGFDENLVSEKPDDTLLMDMSQNFNR